MFRFGVRAYMKVAVLAVVLLLIACGSPSAPHAQASFPPSPAPSVSPFAPPRPSPTPIAATSTPASAPTPVPVGPLTWAAPARVNHLPSFGGSSLNAVSCTTTGLCVAVDDAGNVAVSTNPRGGASAWTVTKVDGTNPLVGISCPTSGLCVAIDSSGNVVTSTNPTAAAGWTVTNVDGPNHLSAVSCATNSLCVAVDRAGNVITSTNPTGGAAAWKVSLLDGSRPLIAVTCLGTGFCVAAREIGATEGEVLVSADPTGGSAAWKFIIGGPLLYGLSCPSRELCVGVEHIGSGLKATGAIYTFSTASGTASALTVAQLSDERAVEPTGVSCPSTTLCIAVDSYGEVLTSTHPTGTAASWTYADVGSGNAFKSISCPSSTLCAGVNLAGSVITSTNPTGKETAWTESNLIGASSLNGVSCPSVRLCVAVGSGGTVVTSNNPTGGAAAWTVTRVAGAGGLSGVSCPTESFCVAVDFNTGNVLMSTDPTGRGATAWRPTKVAQANALNAVSCPTVSFCVAIDSFGNAFVSDDPGDGSPVWKLAHIYGTSCAWTVPQAPPQCILSSVSCPSSTFCVIGDASGDVIVSTNPTGGPASWKTAHVGGADCYVGETGAPCWLAGMACPSSKLCVAGDAQGRVFTSTSPATGAKAWRVINLAVGLDPADPLQAFLYAFDGVSCTSGGFCVALADSNEAGGVVATSTNPAGGLKAWTIAKIGGNEMHGISCPSSALCVAVDRGGEVVTGS